MRSAADVDRGTWIMHKGTPWKIIRRELVAVGTHSHTKLKFMVQSLFTDSTDVITLGHHENVEDVEIIRKKGQVISRSPQQFQVMDIMSYETLNVPVDEHDAVSKEIKEGDEITFVEFNGIIKILEKR